MNDVALVAIAQANYFLNERLVKALGSVVKWMSDHGLQLAFEKTEAIVLTQRHKRNRITVTFEELVFEYKNSVRYLGVQIDARMHFVKYVETVGKKATTTCNQLTR